MLFICENIRYIRKREGLTQEQFAEKIGIKRSLVGAYEEGRAEPSVERLILMSKVFHIRLEDLITFDLSKSEFHPIPDSQSLKVLAITVDQENNEFVNLVQGKAAAGYLNGFADPEYIAELPRIQLPNLKGGTHRAFEVSGDSMLPVTPGTIIIGKYVEDLRSIVSDRTYILVTHSEGVVYKRIFQPEDSKKVLILHSDNSSYSSYELAFDDIREIWEAKLFISSDFPDSKPNTENLLELVEKFHEELLRLKNRN